MCDYHARILLALHGEHTSNYGNAWTDDGPELQAHDARREQTEERQVMTEENDLPNLTTGEWWTLFRIPVAADAIHARREGTGRQGHGNADRQRPGAD